MDSTSTLDMDKSDSDVHFYAVSSHGGSGNGSDVEASDVVSQQFEHDPQRTDEERRVRRKIDMIVLPIMCIVFFMQYLDKQSLAYTSVYGLIDDLHLTPNQYSWLTSGFYLTQLVTELPLIYIMSRLPLATTIAATIVTWGVCCACLAAPSSFTGFLAVRCLLGCAETMIAPAFITLISIWYTKDEHPLRIAAYTSSNGLAQIAGSLMMYGIGENAHVWAIAPWRVMFLMCGALTIFVGIGFYFLMPAGPESAWFLTAEERVVARRRMAAVGDSGDKTTFCWKQFREASLDPQTLHGFVFGICITLCAPVITFATLVIRNLGYSPGQTLLYGSPSGAVQILFIWIGVGLCLVLRKRSLIIMLIGLVPLTGSILLYVLPNDAEWGVVTASWLSSIGASASVIYMSLLASNVRGNTKKSTINAMFNVGYCLGFIIGPQLWTAPPDYNAGIITTITCWVIIISVLMPSYWWLVSRRNRIRDKQQGGPPGLHQDLVVDAAEDLTDRENPHFRYTT